MLSEKNIELVRKNFAKAIIIASFVANYYQYKTAEADRHTYNIFYQQVYNNELERSKKWEELIIARRSGSR